MEAPLVHQGLNRRTWLAALPALTAGCVLPETAAGPRPPPVPREFRGAWVATVANIDWPSRPGLPTADARDEMRQLLTQAQSIGLNAIVLQVRPAADALYASPLEPWSEYLTGESGRAPEPAWDPLAEWTAFAHRLGLELHAWLNPYRVRHPSARSEPAAGHVARAEPAIVRRYGDLLWMDPGDPRSAARLRAVVADLLDRYDIDAVHVDDYFYPYPAEGAGGAEQPFPDDTTWQRHGGGIDRADWRRANVDRLVQALARDVRAARPWVKLGISPFGLPRPDRRPPGIEGFSQYDRLYAHVERWLEEGWLDYLAPQLYWPIAQAPQAFAVLQEAWHRANVRRRHLWPGLFTSRIGAPRNAYDAAEVLAQVALTRTPPAGEPGHLHFSMAALAANRDGIADRLREGPYAAPALTPATPWLAEPVPAPPRVERRPLDGAGVALWPHASAGPALRHAVLWQRRGQRWQWQARAMPCEQPFVAEPADASWIVGIGRSGLESAPRPVDAAPG